MRIADMTERQLEDEAAKMRAKIESCERKADLAALAHTPQTEAFYRHTAASADKRRLKCLDRLRELRATSKGGAA